MKNNRAGKGDREGCCFKSRGGEGQEGSRGGEIPGEGTAAINVRAEGVPGVSSEQGVQELEQSHPGRGQRSL